jgi:CRISPR/Cas system CSM-associated protein Csm2 small subunit|tara:strand:- start:234 stop:500 length:267 start_codon:yes stop_codon:yes gene_type:complete
MMVWLKGALKLIPLILAAVQAVERMSSKKGKDKQDEAVILVGDLVPLIEASVGRDVVDNEKVQSAIRKVIDAIVALQNVAADVKARRA